MAPKKQKPAAKNRVTVKKTKRYNQKTDPVPYDARPYSRGTRSPYENYPGYSDR